MTLSVIEAFIDLPNNSAVTPKDVVSVLENAGIFGVVDWDESGDTFVHVRLSVVFREGTLELPVIDRASGTITNVSDVPGFLSGVAGAAGVRMTVFSDDLEREVFIPSSLEDSLFESAEAHDDSAYEEEVARVAFVMYGGEMFASAQVLKQDPSMLAHELARDIKGPITVVPDNRAVVAFAVDDLEESPTWVDRKPVVEILVGAETVVRWFSKKPLAGGLAGRLATGAFPRHSWLLRRAEPEPRIEIQGLQPELEDAPISSEVLEAYEAQTELLATTVDLHPDYDEDDDDATAAADLADEIGLDASIKAKLVAILSGTDRVDLEDLFEALDVSPAFLQALLPGGDPRSLEGAVHVETPSISGQVGLDQLLARPEGNSFTDRMRRMDFDQPQLAFALEAAMVAAGAGLIYAGITSAGIFTNTWVSIAGYLAGGWLLIDGIGSLVIWSKIRRMNRKGRSN